MKKNYIYAVLTVFIWSTMSTIVKMLLADIPETQALAVSGFFAFVFLLALNIKNGNIKEVKDYSVKDYGIIIGLGFLGLFAYSVLYYYGLSQLTSHEACILNYLWPIMLVIFSCIILKEKMTVLKGVAMLCSFLGIVILSTGKGELLSGNAALGAASCVIAAACYGLFSVLNKKVRYKQNVAMMIMWLVVAICATALGLLTEDWVAIRGVQWIGIIWLGVVVQAVAYLLWALALKGAENTANIANLAYLVPFLSLVLSAVVLKEHIELRAFIALVFIIGGILLQNFYERIREKSK